MNTTDFFRKNESEIMVAGITPPALRARPHRRMAGPGTAEHR
jgi:hypothetical protein